MKKTTKKEFAELDPEEQEKAKQNTFQKRLLRAIKSVTVKVPKIVIPQIILDLCESDSDRAMVLSHLIYLCDKGSRKDGLIWKSFREWKKEIGLSQHRVTKATEWLILKKYLYGQRKRQKGQSVVDKYRIGGHPTLHYKLNKEALVQAIGELLSNQVKDIAQKSGHKEWPERNREIFLKEMRQKSLIKNLTRKACPY